MGAYVFPNVSRVLGYAFLVGAYEFPKSPVCYALVSYNHLQQPGSCCWFGLGGRVHQGQPA